MNYRLTFWEFDGSPSTVIGELDALRHLINYLEYAYWQIRPMDSMDILEQDKSIDETVFAGWPVIW